MTPHEREAVELLPCPFCGGKARKHEYEDEALSSHNIVTWVSIGCSSCDIAMNSSNRDEAIAAWNRRSDRGYAQGVRDCIAALDARMEREEYGHAKAAVALDIVACGELLPKEPDHAD